MADDTPTDAIVAGALFVGGGLAGYLGSRWLRPKEASAATVPTTSAAASVAAPPDAIAISTSTSSTSTTPRPDVPTVAPPLSPLPNPYEDAPVSSPDQLDDAAPVSSPTQVSAPSVTPPAGALPRTFDPLFERYRRDVPIELLRALAMRESGMKPMIKGRAAWGLLQITEVVRADFNRTHNTNHSRERLLEPAINIEIGCWLLRTIADRYQRSHGDVRNMRTDWSNPRFVGLVVLGWNAGWSSGSGVMHVVGRLKELGARDIDIDLVHQNARHLGGGEHLRNAKRVAWCKSVVALYERERAASAVRNASIRSFGNAWLIAEGFVDPVALWDGLCAYFIERRPVMREAGARGWVYPQTTNLDVSQAAMVLDTEIDRREIDPQLHAVLERWRVWKVAFHAHMKKDETRTGAVYPTNESFWLDLSYHLAAALARAPKRKASGGGGPLGWAKDAGGWVWDHKRWLWPVPGVSAGLELVTGGTPELADFVPGVDLVTGAAGAVVDGAKNAADAAANWFVKPLLIGAAGLGGLVVLTTALRD